MAGIGGVLAGANKKKILITSATLSIKWTDELIKLCRKSSLTFLDIPLTGGRVGAETGNLTLLIGGDKRIVEKIEEDLKAISSKVFYLGEAGSGMRYKLILNTLQGIHMAAFGEAMKMAEEFGLNIQIVGEALSDRPGGVITNLAWDNYKKAPNPINFSVKWITKDLIYAKQFVKDLRTPLLDQTLKQYKKAIKLKKSDEDWSSINKE